MTNAPADVAQGARSLVIVPDFGGVSRRSAEARGEEAAGLARAIALDVAETKLVRVRTARPATLFGSGQVESLAADVAAHEAELVIIDAPVTPIQQRNLEKALDAKVIDRTGLILEIFGERAATREGALQVELAHLDYQAGRLVRSWTHLERQRGGFGFLGGPGETQIETDRRLIRDRMAKLRRELDQVKRTRSLHRARRQRAPWPVIALVGYTNAGKSTLFNKLTQSDVMAADLLFATLDPTMRAITLPGIDKAILSDTVGFVSDLPTQLVAAFRATLEEVLSADLIVHVRDIAHPESAEQAADVMQVLGDLGTVTEGEGATPLVEVWNKIDLLDADERTRVLNEAERRDNAIVVSALTGEGMETLRQRLSTRLSQDAQLYSFNFAPEEGEQIAWIKAKGRVEAQSIAEDGSISLDVRLNALDRSRFDALFKTTDAITG